MADNQTRQAREQLLAATSQSGFLASATIASVFELEERLILALLERLGGEAHLPGFAEVLAEPPSKQLVAEFTEDGTYVLSAVDVDG